MDVGAMPVMDRHEPLSPAPSSSLVPFNGLLIWLQIYKAFKNDPVSQSAEGKRGGENEKEQSVSNLIFSC